MLKCYKHTNILNNIVNQLKYCLDDDDDINYTLAFTSAYNISVSLIIYEHGNRKNHIFINIDDTYILKCYLVNIEKMLFGFSIIKINNNEYIDNFILLLKGDDQIKKILDISFNVIENNI